MAAEQLELNGGWEIDKDGQMPDQLPTATEQASAKGYHIIKKAA